MSAAEKAAARRAKILAGQAGRMAMVCGTQTAQAAQDSLDLPPSTPRSTPSATQQEVKSTEQDQAEQMEVKPNVTSPALPSRSSSLPSSTPSPSTAATQLSSISSIGAVSPIRAKIEIPPFVPPPQVCICPALLCLLCLTCISDICFILSRLSVFSPCFCCAGIGEKSIRYKKHPGLNY